MAEDKKEKADSKNAVVRNIKENSVEEFNEDQVEEVTDIMKVDVPTPENMIKVRNVSNRNIHTSVGKLAKKSEGFVTPEELKSEQAKPHEDQMFIEV